MTTYISFLRGINVGGSKVIKMDDLKQTYSELGFTNIKSYIQSGNIVFKYKATEIGKIEAIITKGIEEKHNINVPVIVVSIERLEEIINQNPILNVTEKDYSKVFICFLSSKFNPEAKDEILKKKKENEIVYFFDYALYLYFPDGASETKLTPNFLESKLKSFTTTRNLATSIKMLSLAKEIDTK